MLFNQKKKNGRQKHIFYQFGCLLKEFCFSILQSFEMKKEKGEQKKKRESV